MPDPIPPTPPTPPKAPRGRPPEHVMRDICGNQALQIAGLTSSLEEAQFTIADLQQGLTEALGELNKAKVELHMLKASLAPPPAAPPADPAPASQES